ncbi:hypothetical protein INS49_005328 [Diaporthe citri]|uniref:uncharacterized protein n=1 Tax=Diaporthe citri TaxID=83186 RepID=UPI001C7E7E46|nr:uncharacterized protein INS49_005328 [Diaporthe citri]KAG6353847.1 hypothetical protein INS49_005328 [Diaporthe citri]
MLSKGSLCPSSVAPTKSQMRGSGDNGSVIGKKTVASVLATNDEALSLWTTSTAIF